MMVINDDDNIEINVSDNGELGVTTTSKNYRNNKKDEIKQVTILLDKDTIVGMITNIPALSMQYEGSLKPLLLSEQHNLKTPR